MVRKLRLLLVEDELMWARRIAEQLNRILGADNYDLTREPDQTKGLGCLKERGRARVFFDVVLADAKLPEGTTAGYEILTTAKELCNWTRLFLVSQHFGLPEVLELVTNNQRAKVIAISKSGLNDPYDSHFETAIRAELEKWMAAMVRLIAPTERHKLRMGLSVTGEMSANEIVRVGRDEWQLGHLFLPFFRPLVDQQAIIRCLTPNFSLAFSEAFGILGLKQITHADGRYYSADPIILHKKIREQLGSLDLMLRELGEIPNVADRLTSRPKFGEGHAIIERYAQFKTAYRRTGPRIFDGTLQSLREQFFQFKGSDGVGPQVLIGGCSNILRGLILTGKIEAGGLQIVSTDGCQGREIFEVNIPIHEIFEEYLAEMYKRIFKIPGGKSAGVKTCQVFSTARQIRQEVVDDCDVPLADKRLTDNYLVFRHEAELLPKPETWLEPPQWISAFQTLIPFFGHLYVMTRANLNSDLDVFDCTYSPTSYHGPFQDWVSSINAPTMRCMVDKDRTNKTYYVFCFPAWRQ